jgi:hypothetical protein
VHFSFFTSNFRLQSTAVEHRVHFRRLRVLRRFGFVFHHVVEEIGHRLLVFVDARVHGMGVATRLLRTDPVFEKLGPSLLIQETFDPLEWKTLFSFLDFISLEQLEQQGPESEETATNPLSNPSSPVLVIESHRIQSDGRAAKRQKRNSI